MTPKEAIETLKIAKAEVKWNYPLDYGIALDMAIEDLEKQIPKKTMNKYYCPSCEEQLMGKMNYYENCGQAVDWSEGE